MFLIIIMLLSFALAFVFVLSSIFESNEKKSSKNLIISCLSLAICVSSIVFMGYPHNTEIKYDYSYDIYALEDNSTIKGSRWYFEEDFKYYYCASYKDGKKMYYVNRDDGYIVESQDATPHIEVYKEVYTNEMVKLIKGNSSTILKNEYKIVVPINTVSKNFNVDLKK